MATYLIDSFDIADDPSSDEDARQNFDMIAKHRGKIVLGVTTARRPKGLAPGLNVVIEFPSEEAAIAYSQDPQCRPLEALRMAATMNHTCVLVPAYEH